MNEYERLKAQKEAIIERMNRKTIGALVDALQAVVDDDTYGHSEEVRQDTLRIVRRALELAKGHNPNN